MQLIRDERHDNTMSVVELAARLREWLAGDYRAAVFEVDAAPFGYALFRELPDCMHLRHFFVEREGSPARPRPARVRTPARSGSPADKRVLVEVLTWNAAGLAFWKSVGFAERYLGLSLPATTHSSH